MSPIDPDSAAFRQAARDFLDSLPNADCTEDEAIEAARADAKRTMLEKWGIAEDDFGLMLGARSIAQHEDGQASA